MNGGCFHGEDGTATIFDKLLQNGLGIVVFTVGETGKAADADKVAVTPHHGDGLKQMFTLVAIHDDTAFSFEFPGTCIYVEHDDIHAEVHGSLLGRKTGA